MVHTLPLHSKKETHYRARLAETVKSVAEPLTRHPVSDTHTCIGSSACVKPVRNMRPGSWRHNGSGGAEPQHRPRCLRSGARRRSDLPFVTPTVATNVPGIFFAGAKLYSDIQVLGLI